MFFLPFRVYFQSSTNLQLEFIALRHQITVLQRKSRKPKLKSADRRLWTWLSRSWPRWRSALVIVKPDTVIDWRHGKAGRPGIPTETRDLIRTLSRDNALWGAPRIHSELLKLGIKSLSSVRRQIHGAAAQTAIANMANFSEESCFPIGVYRLLHGSDRTIPGPVRLHRHPT